MAQRVEMKDAGEPLIPAYATKGRARATVVQLYERAARAWSRAPAEIARGLRDARHLHSRERRVVADALHGMIRMRRRLAFMAGLDSAEAASPPPDALYLIWLHGAARASGSQAETAARAVEELARLGVEEHSLKDVEPRLAAIADPIARLAVSRSYPDWLVARVLDALGEAEAIAFLDASNRRAPLLARANRLKTDRDTLAKRLEQEGVPTRPVPLVPDGLELLSHRNAYGLGAFRDGAFELQDTASQLVAEVVAPPPRGRVLDLCAGAGGKTLHLGAVLRGGGRILATDIHDDKLEELRKRARRAGLANVEARRIPPQGPLPLAGSFDRVLVDAPCTGTGVLRRNPEARWRLSPADLVELPRLQLDLLRRAAPLVPAGGRLIYATCSILRDEDEAVVDRFLAEEPGFESVSLKEILGAERALAIGDGQILRTWPHRHDADGFFAAVLRRRRGD